MSGVPSSTVGVEQAGGRRRYAFAVPGLGTALGVLVWFPMALVALVWFPMAVAAQGRDVQRHEPNEPEGRLLAFYAAAVAFSPAGFVTTGERVTFGVELSYVPWLDASQRRPSIDKPEATNLAPVFPRPRLGVQLPGEVGLELSWVPPIRLFDVEANLFGLSLTRRVADVGGVSLSPRVWLTAGRVRGAMTCNEGTMRGHGLELETYYQTVCRGHESDDWFEPRLLGAELIARRSIGSGVVAYLAGGARYDRTRFDIGVQLPDGSRDPDHPVLELRTTRPHMSVGAAWRTGPRWAVGAEGFYAPGSLFTARVTARRVVRP